MRVGWELPPRPVELAPPSEQRPRSRWRRARWVVLAVVVLALAIVLPSYVGALTAPGNDTLGVRSVEWLREHGLRGLVNDVETHYYGATEPAAGGRPSQAPLADQQNPVVAPAPGTFVPPAVPAASPDPSGSPLAHLPPPAPITPLALDPLPGEGLWAPAGRTDNGIPGLYTAFLRPDQVHTSVVVGLAWLDPKLVRYTFVPGLQQPGGPPTSWGGEVPLAQRSSLLATFNSAFKIQDSEGGYYTHGTTVAPLRPGIASLVIDTDGSATVGVWGRDVTMSLRVAVVRQNLHLLVDNGVPTPATTSNASRLWGPTLDSRVFVWRSALGVTADGALVYAAGNGMSVQSLARLLAAAHCVRAMELDINPYWTNFYDYTDPVGAAPVGVTPHKLLPDMQRSLYRYLSPDSRDFVAAQLRE